MIVAILEDVAAQADALAGWLRQAGYEAIVRHDGDSFVELIRQQKVDLLLLDRDVPGPSGIEVLRWARATLAGTLPIVMVTHHDGEEDIVHGLNAGADDYLVKPVRERELIARVNAQLRKYYPDAQRAPRLTVGPYTFDAAERQVYVDDVEDGARRAVGLPTREFDLAWLLFSHAGRIVSKDFLIKNLWGSIDRKYDASLATHISKLRRTLALRAENGVVIATVYNHGYRLERV